VERDGAGYEVIWVECKRENFCKGGWTGSITLLAQRFFPFWRDRILATIASFLRAQGRIQPSNSKGPALPVIASASEAIHFTA
jgi:hypothetical protein